MTTALGRNKCGEARLVPIILRKCDWQSASFGKLLALPKDGTAITLWDDRDEAWTDVLNGIRKVVDERRLA